MMSVSAKFDSAVNSPDGSSFMNGQRGPYAATLDRSGSFREGSENRLASSITGSSRPFPTLSQADAISLSQSLLSDLKPVALDQKYPRQGDVKKLVTSLVGASQDDSSSHTSSGKGAPTLQLEDLKRVKSCLHSYYAKARDRAKYFGELALKYDKYFPSNVTKKRSRSDISSSERSSSLLLGGNMIKNGMQVHPSLGAIDTSSQKSDERSKGGIPNRKIRTSMAVDARMEQRPSPSMKPCYNAGRDKDTLKLVNSNAHLAEEKPPGVASEKGRWKKKRTGVKSDVSDQNVIVARVAAGDREPKQGLQQRLGNDAQPRLSNSLGFRTTREDAPLGSTAAAANRVSTTARAPRSSGFPSRASPSVHRTGGSSEESDILPFTNKNASSLASGNRKRTASTRSSSPPVTPWVVGQRHHKMSRSARRTNFPPVIGHDDNTFSDVDTCVRTTEGIELSRHVSISSGQIKATGEHTYSTGLSESEESSIIENKLKERVRKCVELEEKVGQALHRDATPSFASRKNKTSGDDDELGDGARKLARPGGRAFPPSKPGIPSATEKLESAGSAQQPRTANLDPDRVECKPGRPTTKKFQERKGYSRHRFEGVETPGETEDDHEELMDAAKSALNTRNFCPNPFWNHMERFFALISTEDSTCLKQNNLDYCSLLSKQAKAARDDCEEAVNGVDFNKWNGSLGLSTETEQMNEQSLKDVLQKKGGISMCQLLLSALIEEDEESEPYYCKGREEECFSNDTCSMQFANDLDSKSNESDHLPLENAQRVRAYSNGYINARFRYYDEPNSHSRESYNVGPEYSQRQMDERILLELNEIGLYPELMPDLAQSEDEDINEGIKKLEEKLHKEVKLKKNMLTNLEKTVMEVKESQERDLERVALDKLVSIAYGKYMALRVTNSSGSKSTNKIAKQRVLSFAKRTLERYQTFDQTGKSCFSEPPFQEIFHSFSSTSITEDVDILSGVKSSTKHEKHTDTTTTNPLEHALGKDELWSNKVKKRELLLNVGVGNLVSGTKGKRSERDRDGKRGNRDATARSGTSRVGRPALSNAKGERKNKTKHKHKISQMSASLSDILGSDNSPSAPTKSEHVLDGNTKQKDSSCVVSAGPSMSQDLPDDNDALDFTSLQLPGIDVLGVPDDFGSQPQDFGSWFNIDDDGLQDQDLDLVGLEIPMDDLSMVL